MESLSRRMAGPAAAGGAAGWSRIAPPFPDESSYRIVAVALRCFVR